jgi:hypothetical protein
MSDQNYVHIMAHKTKSDHDADNTPFHVDSMPEDDWISLKLSTDQFTANNMSDVFHTTWLEADTKTKKLVKFLE